ncbi:ASCH domain-containing protein [Polynucleobacter sp. MWH-Spelu-300-X4]|uniref:ASCH domain-containing protein n=1 Tax=Polynucleobacter sp. MWH-Spelu-300-X4 TaxID=2689109 RepID=UPI001BFE4C7F|nr:ASCH domain-containing protein [Polynucleobacter sp. MWH-Spelu-300-X4]QWD79243.1 ASCH domain-containing protein [Polynucleobacter sp. MWH-Spelu-300-X4]
MTTNLKKFFNQRDDKVIVLSIKPQYADLILAKIKTVEFRRTWAAEDVNTIAIYASSPIQRIVGLVKVEETLKVRPSKLWKICSEHSGGLTKRELLNYFNGKSLCNAVLLKDAVKFKQAIDPNKFIENFYPPQSFQYLNLSQVNQLKKLISDDKS